MVANREADVDDVVYCTPLYSDVVIDPDKVLLKLALMEPVAPVLPVPPLPQTLTIIITTTSLLSSTSTTTAIIPSNHPFHPPDSCSLLVNC
ncbi:hypothetical protein ACOSQ2_007344 [Xanthoceras sorbifolium]